MINFHKTIDLRILKLHCFIRQHITNEHFIINFINVKHLGIAIIIIVANKLEDITSAINWVTDCSCNQLVMGKYLQGINFKDIINCMSFDFGNWHIMHYC